MIKILNNFFALHARTIIFGLSGRCYAVFKRIASPLFLTLTAWLYHMAKIFLLHDFSFTLTPAVYRCQAWLDVEISKV